MRIPHTSWSSRPLTRPFFLPFFALFLSYFFPRGTGSNFCRETSNIRQLMTNSHYSLLHHSLLRQRSISWITGCFEILLPKECLVCGRNLKGHRLCHRCAPQLPQLSSLISCRCARCFCPTPNPSVSPCPTCRLHATIPDSQRFLWTYEGIPRDLIKAMKYRPSITLTRMCGRMLADALPALFTHCHWDLLVPVPSSASTFRERLFHPCYEMARLISQVHKLPIEHALAHDPERKPQAKLHHDARLRNLNHLFNCRNPRRITGTKILLVEDVITTGATISAAADCLLRAGAARVDVVALARTAAWSRFRAKISEIFREARTYPALPITHNSA